MDKAICGNCFAPQAPADCRWCSRICEIRGKCRELSIRSFTDGPKDYKWSAEEIVRQVLTTDEMAEVRSLHAIMDRGTPFFFAVETWYYRQYSSLR